MKAVNIKIKVFLLIDTEMEEEKSSFFQFFYHERIRAL